MSAALQERLEASSYLSGLRDKTHISLDLSVEQLVAQMSAACATLDQYSFTDGDPETPLKALFKSKHIFTLCWSLCEMQGHLSAAKRGDWQTRFAESSIDFALRLGWLHVARKHAALVAPLKSLQGRVPGLFIFGMGKLGGGDLNFSSDIDLVAYFDATVLPVPDVLGKSYVCNQVLQQLTAVLGRQTDGDFIWRVDWRLRPDASANTLAMAASAAREYYFYRASPWHRLALMKARVVAGDAHVGNQFLQALAPFIWRQNLDYRALDELAEIKQRINLEHPALRSERLWQEAIGDDITGFNLKLGSGGIREVEFIVNALQLVWGGKHFSLRTPNTLDALAKLRQLGHITDEIATALTDGYQILRRVENAVQMLANQQTHLLPSEVVSQTKLLKLLDLTNWQELADRLNRYRNVIHGQFEGMFTQQETEIPSVQDWPQELSQAALDIVAEWDNGFLGYGVSAARRHRLRPLAHALALALQRVERRLGIAEASATVLRLHDFFRALPQGEQYFRLLARSPRLLDNIIAPLMYSPPMSLLLRQSPHIIDCYVQATSDFSQPDFDIDSVLLAKQYDERLERLRRFVNEHLYQIYALFMQGEMSVERFQLRLTELAEQTIQLALRVVADNLEMDEAPVAVLGFGKLGMRKMAPTSDLDLVFIFDGAATSLEVASRFVTRLQTAIASPMREGIVYELDTRLRPSGRAGAATVSLESFAKHQLERAHTWEHIALAPGRVVAGSADLSDAIMRVRAEVLARQRETDQFLRDARKMWGRVAEHRVQAHPQDVMFSKLRPGGLMQSEYLAACYVLQNAQAKSGQEFDALVARSSLLKGSDNLNEIMQFWRTQQLWERLLGNAGQSLSRIPRLYLEVLLRHSQVDSLEELVTKKAAYAEQIEDAMRELFAPLENSAFHADDWQEIRVNWRAE